MPSRSFLPAVTLLLSLAAFAGAAEPTRIHGIDLVWHWEGAGSSGGHQEDVAINPASVVKLATTLWALETLGPDHRFRTTVAIRVAGPPKCVRAMIPRARNRRRGAAKRPASTPGRRTAAS